jgi:hypothetical protein
MKRSSIWDDEYNKLLWNNVKIPEDCNINFYCIEEYFQYKANIS